MIAYKGFRQDLTCIGYQFVKGKNITKEANCVKNGFHCAENPLDCFLYYPNWQHSVYWMVEAAGDLDEDGYDSKISCTELTLLKEMTMQDMFAAAMGYYIKHPERKFEQGTRGPVRVSKDYGEDGGTGFLIIRGKSPKAYVKAGQIAGFLVEETGSAMIIGARIFQAKEAGIYLLHDGQPVREAIA